MHLHFDNYPEGWTFSTPGASLFWGGGDELVCIFNPPVLNKMSMGTKILWVDCWGCRYFYCNYLFRQIKSVNKVELKHQAVIFHIKNLNY